MNESKPFCEMTWDGYWLKRTHMHGIEINTIVMLRYLLHYSLRGWSGGALVLGKLPVPRRPTYLRI